MTQFLPVTNLRLGAAQLVFCLCVVCYGGAFAQYSDIEDREQSTSQRSDVVGWHPTEATSEDDPDGVGIMTATVKPVYDSADADGWGSGQDQTLAGRLADSFLTPMIPGEALLVQHTSTGTFRASSRLGLPFSVSRRKAKVDYLLGPLAVDFLSIGTIALHSSLSGPGADRFNDDGFLGATTLNTAVHLQLTDTATLRINTALYYLYTENKFGFFFGNGAPTSAELRYQTRLGAWDFDFYDRVRVFFPLSDALDDVQIDEIAVAGRYRFGRVDFVDPNPFGDEQIYFFNTIGATASTRLSDDLKLKLRAEHWDIWQTDSFVHRTEADRLGAGLFYDSHDLWLMPWATYDWYDINAGSRTVNHATVGASLPFTRTLNAYVRGAWISSESEDGRSLERPGWEVGAVHHINRSLTQSAFTGYNFVQTEIGEPFIGSYWRYSIRWAPVGTRTSFTAYAQEHTSDLAEWTASTLGARVETRLTEKTRLTLAASRVNAERGDTSYFSNIMRATLTHRLSRRLTGSLTWQTASFDFPDMLFDIDEQLFMLSLKLQL